MLIPFWSPGRSTAKTFPSPRTDGLSGQILHLYVERCKWGTVEKFPINHFVSVLCGCRRWKFRRNPSTTLRVILLADSQTDRQTKKQQDRLVVHCFCLCRGDGVPWDEQLRGTWIFACPVLSQISYKRFCFTLLSFIRNILLLFFTGRTPRSGVSRYLNLLSGQKSAFCPLAEKLWIGSKNCWHLLLSRRALSPCKVWVRSNNAVGAKMWCLYVCFLSRSEAGALFVRGGIL